MTNEEAARVVSRISYLAKDTQVDPYGNGRAF